MTPSLTLARRLYARKHGFRLRDVEAVVEGEGFEWTARVYVVPEVEEYGLTESAAIRNLCRALGWKP